jgi:hypothetical protein
MEFFLQFERMGVLFDNRVWVLFPQFFTVTEQNKRMAHVEVISQGSMISWFAQAEIISSIAKPAVMVGENDDFGGL